MSKKRSEMSPDELREWCRVQRRQYYLKNREKILARTNSRKREIRENPLNREKVAAQTKAWRLRNPEHARYLRQRWRSLNPQRVSETRKAWNERRLKAATEYQDAVNFVALIQVSNALENINQKSA